MIINMAERLKDNEDRKLESLFASDAIEDNGFSSKVMRRVRRQIWVRRLALPVAFVVGGSIAVKPLSELVTALISMASALPAKIGIDSSVIPMDLLPGASTIMFGLMAVLAFVMIGKMLED